MFDFQILREKVIYNSNISLHKDILIKIVEIISFPNISEDKCPSIITISSYFDTQYPIVFTIYSLFTKIT